MFKIEFTDYVNYVKEMTVGYKWIKCNLDETTEKSCFKLYVGSSLHKYIDLEGDSNIPCVITRIS